MKINEERLITEFCHLVSIDSPTCGERQMGDYLTQQLKALGLAVTEDTAGQTLGGNCGNIYGYLEGDADLTPLLFCAHMDTVEPSHGKKAMLDADGTIRSAGDTILGADDCSGVVAILEALRTITEQKLAHPPIEVLFTVAEEVYCVGASVFDFSQVRSKEAYVLDLSGPVGGAAHQAPTIVSFDITVTGRASHAGFAPQDGVHTIQAAALAISQLPLGRIHEDTTLNIGVIGGGVATNIVPAQCKLSGEVRSLSHAQAMETMALVKKQFEQSATAIGATTSLTTKITCKAYRTAPEHPVVERFFSVCQALGIATSLAPTFGGSDNNVMAEHGISGLVVACAMNSCHSSEEYTTTEELCRIATITLALMTSGATPNSL